MGGTDDPSNLVQLTVEQHAEAHRKLYEEYGNIEDYLAWRGLNGSIDKQTIIKELQSLGGKKGGKALKGKKLSENTKKKMSDAHKGKIVNEELRTKIKNSNLGKKRSKHTINKITESRIGTTQTEKVKTKISESMKIYHEKRKRLNGQNNY
jgi:hypothetical protein